MALKPTIYKFTISVSDLDRQYYNQLNLTVAQHPSESIERMMTRVIAFCMNASEQLTFTKGLSSPDEPDIWEKSLDDQLLLWIDVGEPQFDRIKKATRLAKKVKIYSFNNKSDVWWQQSANDFNTLPVIAHSLPWQKVHDLASLIVRTMDFSITISESTCFISTDSDDVEIPCHILQER